MADRRAKVRDSLWWERMRHEYISKNEILFSSYPQFEYVCPYDFYRTIFPVGFLQDRGELIPWDQPGGGKPNAIALQITNSLRKITTKSGLKREIPKIERYTWTDDLDGVEERVFDSIDKNENVFVAPVSYFGKARVSLNARFLHAFAIDLDGVSPSKLMNLLKQIDNGKREGNPIWTSIPQPTFMVNSGTGLHLYYVLNDPIPLVPNAVPFLQELKERLTDYVWRDTTSDMEEKQFQGIYQSFRMPGTPTKLNGKDEFSKIKDKYEAVAFVHMENGVPYKCSIEYLLQFAGYKGKGREELLKLAENAGRTPIERARELWPEWYERRVVQRRPTGRWTCKRDLYEWWKKQISEKATDGQRYWCLNVLAAYADKCGVPYDELEKDALEFVPLLESLTTRADNHFEPEHALAAISSYGDGIIHKLTVERIERRTKIDIPRNKRNGRDQVQHLKVMRAIQSVTDPDGLWRNKNGRPVGSGTKERIVKDFAEAHPEMSHSEIARSLGISRPTVIKWLKNSEDALNDE